MTRPASPRRSLEATGEDMGTKQNLIEKQEAQAHELAVLREMIEGRGWARLSSYMAIVVRL